MSLYEVKQPFGVPVVAHDAPRRRVMPSTVSLEATLAAMQADAKAWRKRKASAWGEGMCVRPERLSRANRVAWSVETNAGLANEIVAALAEHGPMTMAELAPLIRSRCPWSKLRSMLTQMKKAGQVVNRQLGRDKHLWAVAK